LKLGYTFDSLENPLTMGKEKRCELGMDATTLYMPWK
jgi:hypothetical protein